MSVRSRQAKVFAALLVSITVGAIILKALGNNPPSAGAFCLSRYYRLDPVEKTILSRATQYAGRWSHIEIYYSGTGAPTQSGNAVTCGSDRHIPDAGCSMPGYGGLPGSGLGLRQDERPDELDTRRESRIRNRELRCHFFICNGRIGHDGQILSTEIWQRQCSPHQLHQSGQSQTSGTQRCIGVGQLVRDKSSSGRSSPEPGSERTIHICVIANDKDTRPVGNSTIGNMIQKGKISNGARPTDFQIKRTEALVEALSRRFNIRPGYIHYPDNWQ